MGVLNAERSCPSSFFSGLVPGACPAVAAGVWRPSSSPCPSSSSSGLSSAVRRPSSSSPGIALVMVLGILSVMVIMAVAFAISMRTERVAAGNYADSVRARQLVHVGLARALNDLAVNLGPTGLYQPDGKVYPNWPVTNSYSATYTNNTAANLYLVFATNDSTRANEATNFVPRALWAAATNADYLNTNKYWVPVDSITYTNGVPVGSNRMGRVKYLILNCSGLLDANFVGGADRGPGTNPMEITFDGGTMPEIKMGGYSAFINNRATNVRYETQAELAELNINTFRGAPSNFTVYSYAPPGYWTNNGFSKTNQVNLEGDRYALNARKAEIIPAFVKAGLGAYANILFTNLLDYVDDNYKPENYETAVEPVPMISRITYSSTSGTAPYYITVTFTLWYPFVNVGGGNYSFDADVEIVGAGLMPHFHQSPITLAPGQTTDISQTSSGITAAGPYTIKINSAVVKRGVDPVDQLLINLGGTPLPTPLVNGRSISWGCIDPRFNYEVGNPGFWKEPVPSFPDLGPLNGATRAHWAAHPDDDTNANMYVANTNLKSVAELGYLAYAPWKTVKLYGLGCQRVLDVFTIGTNVATCYGRVNPNSRETDALAAVFNGMKVETTTTNGLTWDEAINIAGQLQTNAQVYGFYTNLSDVGRYFTNFPSIVTNEWLKKVFFCNTMGLLSVQQNLFTIIIEAHVASGGNIPRNPVKQRAVALVWRDPYTGEMFVRNIKWLKD